MNEQRGFRGEEIAVNSKVTKITEAAHKLFLSQGFGETSMDAVSKEALVSKATLYAYFPSKEALFANLIRSECRAFQDRIRLPDLDLGLKPAMKAFAQQYIALFLDRHGTAFFRALCSEARRFPQLAELFFASGPEANQDRVSEFLDEVERRGLLHFSDTRMAATQLVSLIRGELHLYAILDLPPPSKKEVDAMLDSSIDLFLRGYSKA
jgi:TetR/AcrR family transcriptional repressor of mexJK operon